MKTRQHRLNSVEEIKRKLSDLNGREINIVLRNRTVLLGSVVKSSAEGLEVRNLRGRASVIPLAEISEIYFDTKE